MRTLANWDGGKTFIAANAMFDVDDIVTHRHRLHFRKEGIRAFL